MTLNYNEKKIIEMLRNADVFTTIVIFKKGCRDQTEYKIQVQKSIMLKRKIDKPENGLL